MPKETSETDEVVFPTEEDELNFLSALIAKICSGLDKYLDETEALVVITDFISTEGLSLESVPDLVKELKNTKIKGPKSQLH